MDFRFTPEEEALRKEFDDFFRKEMKNAPPEWYTALEPMVSIDICAAFHRQMAKKLGAKGWLARPWPREYGGQDASLIEQFIFSDVMGYHRGAGFEHRGVGMLAPTLLVSGNDEQKREPNPVSFQEPNPDTSQEEAENQHQQTTGNDNKSDNIRILFSITINRYKMKTTISPANY